MQQPVAPGEGCCSAVQWSQLMLASGLRVQVAGGRGREGHTSEQKGKAGGQALPRAVWGAKRFLTGLAIISPSPFMRMGLSLDHSTAQTEARLCAVSPSACGPVHNRRPRGSCFFSVPKLSKALVCHCLQVTFRASLFALTSVKGSTAKFCFPQAAWLQWNVLIYPKGLL